MNVIWDTSIISYIFFRNNFNWYLLSVNTKFDNFLRKHKLAFRARALYGRTLQRFYISFLCRNFINLFWGEISQILKCLKSWLCLVFGILIIKHWKVFPTTVRRNLMILVTIVSVICFLFVELFVALLKFSRIWRRQHYRLMVANFDLWSALMAIEQWGFVSVSQLL